MTWIEQPLIPCPDGFGLKLSNRRVCTGQCCTGSFYARLEHAELAIKSRHAPRLYHKSDVPRHGKQPVSRPASMPDEEKAGGGYLMTGFVARDSGSRPDHQRVALS